jgi:hypothetical protein
MKLLYTAEFIGPSLFFGTRIMYRRGRGLVVVVGCVPWVKPGPPQQNPAMRRVKASPALPDSCISIGQCYTQDHPANSHFKFTAGQASVIHENSKFQVTLRLFI